LGLDRTTGDTLVIEVAGQEDSLLKRTNPQDDIPDTQSADSPDRRRCWDLGTPFAEVLQYALRGLSHMLGSIPEPSAAAEHQLHPDVVRLWQYPPCGGAAPSGTYRRLVEA